MTLLFDEFNVCEALRRGVRATGFRRPTPVQEQVIPVALEGKDLLVFAENGSGKTAAFGLPILERFKALAVELPPLPAGALTPAPVADASGSDDASESAEAEASESQGADSAESSEGEGAAASGAGSAAAAFAPVAPSDNPNSLPVRVLILGPTRESVTRAEAALRAYGQFLQVRVRAIFGGVPAAPQRDALRRGIHVVAATPGRLSEILRLNDMVLDKVEVLVLDELDHLVQMNLMNEVQSIVERVTGPRQTLVFAGRRTPELEALASQFVRNPTLIEIPGLVAPLDQVRQAVYAVEHNQKVELLIDLFRNMQPRKAVVFCRTRRSVDRLFPMMEQLGRKVAVLHAERTAAQRQTAIELFSIGAADTLLATEMAVRTLEAEDITHLFNFDLPQFHDDYVNRIARCSQGAPVGEVYSLVSAEDRDALRRLERSLGAPLTRLKLDSFTYVDRGRRGIDRLLAPATAPGQPVPATDAPGNATAAGTTPYPVAPGAAGPQQSGYPGSPRGFRPVRPLPPLGTPAPYGAPHAGAADAPPVAPAATPSASATAPAAPLAGRGALHPMEKLSGRLVRGGASATPPAQSGASAPSAPAPAPSGAPRAGAPALPGTTPPAGGAAPSRAEIASRYENLSGRRPSGPPASPLGPGGFPPRRGGPASKLPTPPPVSAMPALAPPSTDPLALSHSPESASIPTIAISQATGEGMRNVLPARLRPVGGDDRKDKPEWMEEEEEAIGELVTDSDEEGDDDDAEGEAEAAAPGGAPGRGGRPARGGRRQPRKIRSWDLHRGGLLDPPPLHSTPFEGFILEEREARKNESRNAARLEWVREGNAPLPDEEPDEREGYSLEVPIDHDHPATPNQRESTLTAAWSRRIERLLASAPKLNQPQLNPFIIHVPAPAPAPAPAAPAPAPQNPPPPQQHGGWQQQPGAGARGPWGRGGHDRGGRWQRGGQNPNYPQGPQQQGPAPQGGHSAPPPPYQQGAQRPFAGRPPYSQGRPSFPPLAQRLMAPATRGPWSGVQPLPLPSWPMAANSGTTSATAPGIWWNPNQSPTMQVRPHGEPLMPSAPLSDPGIPGDDQTRLPMPYSGLTPIPASVYEPDFGEFPAVERSTMEFVDEEPRTSAHCVVPSTFEAEEGLPPLDPVESAPANADDAEAKSAKGKGRGRGKAATASTKSRAAAAADTGAATTGEVASEAKPATKSRAASPRTRAANGKKGAETKSATAEPDRAPTTRARAAAAAPKKAATKAAAAEAPATRAKGKATRAKK